MKLNRRGFLRATGLTVLLAAFGIELPEVIEKQALPVPHGISLMQRLYFSGPLVPLPPTADSVAKWDGERWMYADSNWPTHPNCRCVLVPLQAHKSQHTIAISDELAADGGFRVPSDFRSWLAEYCAKATEAEMLEAT